MYAGKVDAYIKLELDLRDVVECDDELGRDIYLYPDNDLVIEDYMNPKIGFTTPTSTSASLRAYST